MGLWRYPMQKIKKSENMRVCVDLLFNSQFQSKHRKRLLKIRMEIVPENQWSWNTSAWACVARQRGDVWRCELSDREQG